MIALVRVPETMPALLRAPSRFMPLKLVCHAAAVLARGALLYLYPLVTVTFPSLYKSAFATLDPVMLANHCCTIWPLAVATGSGPSED